MGKGYREVLKPDESSIQDTVYSITEKMAELSEAFERVQRDSALLVRVMDNTSNRVEVLTKEKEKLEEGLMNLSNRLLIFERENERKRRRWQEFKDFALGLLFVAICVLALYGAVVLMGFY